MSAVEVKTIAVASSGHPLTAAFVVMKTLGSEYVELACLSDYSEEFSEDLLSPSKAVIIRQQVSERGMDSPAFAAQIDLGNSASVSGYARRMDFANPLVTNIVITKATHRKSKRLFRASMERLILRPRPHTQPVPIPDIKIIKERSLDNIRGHFSKQ